MCIDLGEYPESHVYMFYTNSDHVPPAVHSAIDSMSDCNGLRVSDMLCKASKSLDKATAGCQHNPVDLEGGDPMEVDSDDGKCFQGFVSTVFLCRFNDQSTEPKISDESDDYESEAGGWSPKSPQHRSSGGPRAKDGTNGNTAAMNARIRHDLRQTKESGFRVGHLGNLLNGGQDCFVTISCRVSKLGISEEALQAWHLEPSQYFLLLIRYTAGYKDLDRLIGSAMAHGESGVQMRAGLSSRYKIAIDEAIAVFSSLEDKSKSNKLMSTESTSLDKPGGLERLFIGRPLEELLNDRLLPLLRYRMGMGMPWGGAEDFFNDHQGRNLTDQDAIDPKYWAEDASHHLEALPKIVTQDHFDDRTKEKSFPLLAMQFALRHLVRCTEFCLVCHCKVETDFEALKPYVCSKPLCLYQYMSLGFGPSIEHEIMTQPHVVDLLMSFCYTSASYQKLRYLPTGMALMVPSPSLVPQTSMLSSGYYPSPFPSGGPDGIQTPKTCVGSSTAQPSRTYKARFDQQRMELIFDSGSQKVLYSGDWITFVAPATEERYHCRVSEVMHPTARLGQPIARMSKPTIVSTSQRHLGGSNIANLTPATTPPPASSIETLPRNQHALIEFAKYDQNFDDLDDSEKQRSIVMLLDNMPSIPQMTSFLKGKGGQDTSLRAWADRISPASLGLLRWIIASNRSCIVQVDSLEGNARPTEERVSGMAGWMQFRFAQGAPDKEQRFVTSIRETTPNAKHPTLFAWHGSPLHNWHGIVREGLHFEKADHGRAFGNGCYHSLQCATSMGYSSMHSYSYRTPQNGEGVSRSGEWPQSQLKISQAIALNEIVNAPAKFVSKNPHVVVAQLDWIQSRYLFVKCNILGLQISENPPSQVYEQDPAYTPVGERSEKIVIPITAVSKSRRPVSKDKSAKIVKTGNKKVKVDNVQDAEEAAILSDETDVEDLTVFMSGSEEEPEIIAVEPSKGKNRCLPDTPSQQLPDKSKTDFVPGSLDHKTLPLLEPPSYATSMATRALQRELTATLKVQDTHPSHELGWYIDRELVSNVYQWIVELHSFESQLPIAKDMKQKGIKSVVMEVRFGNNYPMSPPFVRVIRPRFLSFMQGGGGHVTAGGALCMELLTNNGWSAVSNIESVLLQVRLAMSSTDPKPARLEQGPVRDYSVGEAIEAFIRACHTHGVSFIHPHYHKKTNHPPNSGKFQQISSR